MSKKNIARTLIYLIELGLFNIFVFFLISEYTTVFWITYAFTTIAFLSQIPTSILFDKYDLNLKFLSLPIIYANVAYLVAQVITCLVCLIIPVSNTFAIIVQITILAIYITIVLVSVVGKEQIINVDNDIKKKTNNIYMLITESELLYVTQEDASKKSELKKLYETIKYSDPVSSTEKICMLDDEIYSLIQNLKIEIPSLSADDLKEKIKPILELVTKRNIICKASK